MLPLPPGLRRRLRESPPPPARPPRRRRPAPRRRPRPSPSPPAASASAPTTRSWRVSEFSCHISGCCQVFDTLEGYEHHYNTLHRNVCSFCKRSFPSGHLLDIHILEWHDSLFQIMAEKQNMYKCLVEGCAEKLKSSKDRKDHLVTVHLYPADFRFDRPKKTKSVPKHVSAALKQGASVPMDVSVETSEQFQADPMEIGPGENMEIPQPAASPGPSVPEKRLYKSRVPSTICFGQGATRGFKGPRKKCGQGWVLGVRRELWQPTQRLPGWLLCHLSASPRATRLCSITVLLGAALLLPAPGGAQAPSDTEWKDLATKQDLAKEIILGVRAVEPLEEGETSNGLQPGIKVFSSSAWTQWGLRQAQAGPEEDRDHLHHPQDDAREDDAHGLPRTLSLEVQSGLEEDRDHLHHG
ncbi:unnamed protein product [Bubo scandiacus]